MVPGRVADTVVWPSPSGAAPLLAMCPTDADRARSSKLGSRLLGAPRDHLQAAWETSFDTIVVVDADRRYRRVNPAAEELLAAPAEEIIDCRIDDFTPPELHGVLRRLWVDFERRGSLHSPYESPYEMLRADGTRDLVEFRAVNHRGCGERLIVARRAVARPSTHDGAHVARRLTAREREILQLAADVGSIKAIAEILVLSPGTVKSHFEHVYAKLGVRDRASAVAEGLRSGLIE